LTKARLLQRDELPPEYAPFFCRPGGVDGQFLRHFELTKEDILALAPLSDEEAGRAFLARVADRPGIVANWNEIAVNLGRPGYPMEQRFPVAKATTYQHIHSENMDTVFQLLEADEMIG
jgi:hypothetical protein